MLTQMLSIPTFSALMPALIKPYSSLAENSDLILPPEFHGWPSPSQLASAEPKLGHDMAHAHAGDNTTQPAHWQTGM